MEDLSLHILDIAENSIQAGASLVIIRIHENIPENCLTLITEDNGRGMNQAIADKAKDPFFTTRTTRRIGLGLALLEQSAKEANGTMEVTSESEKGTRIVVTFENSHIDRKPLGNIVDTLITLIAGNPDRDFLFEYVQNNRKVYSLNTSQIKSELGSIPISDILILEAIKNDVEQGLETLL